MKYREDILINGCIYYFIYNQYESKQRYTQKIVYDVTTEEENVEEAKYNILNIMYKYYGDMISKELYKDLNEKIPSFTNYLTHYYELTYNAKDDTYKFTLTIPYDD